MLLIERCKCSQGVISKFPKVLFDTILPIYICLYLLFFMITIPMFFRGLRWTDNVHLAIYPKGITGCLFNEGLPTIMYVGCALDTLNTIILLFLFIYPLHILLKQRRKLTTKCTAEQFAGVRAKRRVHTERSDELEIIMMRKINVMCTSLSTITGAATLLLSIKLEIFNCMFG